MDVMVRIRRYDPEGENPESYWQEYPVTMDDSATVLDALIKIREEQDGTLTLRCSCRSSICGSCAMRINGHAGLACKTQANDALVDGNIIVLFAIHSNIGVLCSEFWRGLSIYYSKFTKIRLSSKIE